MEQENTVKPQTKIEKRWFESKKIIAFLISLYTYYLLIPTGPPDWKVRAVNACFIFSMYVALAFFKTYKDVQLFLKQVDELIEPNTAGNNAKEANGEDPGKN